MKKSQTTAVHAMTFGANGVQPHHQLQIGAGLLTNNSNTLGKESTIFSPSMGTGN